jgi:hypothetical protein
MATTNDPKSGSKASRTADAGEAELQQIVDQEEEQGYRGTVADPTPNHAYTVGGVTSGEPTPETDEAASADAASRRAELDKKGGAR